MTPLAKNQSRMFRTIVLMGSSLALSCGGKAGEDSPPTSGGSGGSTSAGGLFGTSGGGASNGGSAHGGASVGGALSTAGASQGGAVGVGGSPVGGAAAVAGSGGTPDCPAAEWTCTASICNYDTGWQLADCKCDPSHPKSASDCKAGQAFVCLSTSSSAAGPAQGFDCQCVPSNQSCAAECTSAYPGKAGQFFDCDAQAEPVLCGCAIVLLK